MIMFGLVLFLTSLIINLTLILSGIFHPSSLWVSLILGIPVLTEYYFNKAQGIIWPASKLDPNYKVTQIKEHLNPKLKKDPAQIVLVNGKCTQRRHFTALDYLIEKLKFNENQISINVGSLTHQTVLDYLKGNLRSNPNERIRRRLSLLPVKGVSGYFWLRPYYEYSIHHPMIGLFQLTEPNYITEFISVDLKDLESYVLLRKEKGAEAWL
jgi:hypothetical protein